jgi:L-ribulokinase
VSYAIGLDYGTESGRVLLLDLASGREAAVAVVPYRHGVISDRLPTTGEALPPDWALEDPRDYLEVLDVGIPAVLKEAGVAGNEVVGIGLDVTSCTVLPVTADGIPLCTLPQWNNHRHAWLKLWKHHSAQAIADRITATAERRHEPFLARYGGRISSEWYFPKLLEVFEEDRAVYDAAYAFVEATDWLVWHLTGVERRSVGPAGYKALWSAEEGLPSVDFFRAVEPAFDRPDAKLGTAFYPLGHRAGGLRPEVADRLGLPAGVAVAVGNIDAMAAVPGAGVGGPGTLVMVMGTSICHLTVTEAQLQPTGVTGVVRDGVLPGYYGYEAGQAAVGDMFAWFVRTLGTGADSDADGGARAYERLEAEAGALAAGQNGLLALDWWNGNRSILGDADLTGAIVGLTLATTPPEIYRALLEATAFGTRRILDNLRGHGIPIRDLVACGGLATKSPLLMQIFADVSGLEVRVPDAQEIPARGAALFGAVAAGAEAGGFASIADALARLAPPVLRVYRPDAARRAVYDEMYALYERIHDVFGRERPSLMHTLKRIRKDALAPMSSGG